MQRGREATGAVLGLEKEGCQACSRGLPRAGCAIPAFKFSLTAPHRFSFRHTAQQEKLKVRNKVGFQAAGTRRRSAELKATSPSILQRLSGMMDPTVTLTTLINEGLVYVGLALW